MASDKPSVALLTGSAALGSILRSILERYGDLRVTGFTSYEALTAHLRLVPANLIICDYEQQGWNAPEMLVNLRQRTSHPTFRSMVLTSYVSREVRQACAFAQVDEVIIKPMSPLFLEERVRAHLSGYAAPASQPLRGIRTDAPANGENVVPLFGQTRRPAQH